MKLRLLLPLFLLVLLAGCQRRPSGDTHTLTVSIEPLRFVVQAIAGDRYHVVTIMPQGASPETYEPTPRQMVDLSSSRLVFRAGALGFEGTKLPALAESAGCELVDLGTGITPIRGGHSHEGHDSHADGHEDSADPHTWMSPANLRIMAANACRALCRIDTAGATYYRQRLAAFDARIDSLDRQLTQLLQPARQRTFLIYHPALGYFARAYGLQQLAVEHDGKEPSAAYVRALADTCRTKGVRTVFISEEHSGQGARRLAEALSARVVTINPLAYDVPAQMLYIARTLHD